MKSNQQQASMREVSQNKYGSDVSLTAKMKNSVASVDVREETVPQSLALRGSLDQPSDVHDVQESRHFAVNISCS